MHTTCHESRDEVIPIFFLHNIVSWRRVNHFIQLLSKINCSSLSEDKADHLLLRICPAIENSLSQGILVAGIIKLDAATLDCIGNVFALSNYQLHGSSSCEGTAMLSYMQISFSNIPYKALFFTTLRGCFPLLADPVGLLPFFPTSMAAIIIKW